MTSQNKIPFGRAPPPQSINGYSPKKRLQVNKVASVVNPIDVQQIVQLTVPANTFGTEHSNTFERQKSDMEVDKGSMMNYRLFQLFCKVAYDSKDIYDGGASKKKKEEPKIIGDRGQNSDDRFFVNENSSIWAQFSGLETGQVETWAAQNSYQIVTEYDYMQAWDAFSSEGNDGDGRVYVFFEAVPRDYNHEELKHAAAYRIWIVFEKGCGIDVNDRFKDVIFPPENKKQVKKKDIEYFDQYRLINNIEKWRHHISVNRFKNSDALQTDAIDVNMLTNETSRICPTTIFGPRACFDNATFANHNGSRVNVLGLLFPKSVPDTQGFVWQNYMNNAGQFIVQEKQRGYMVELNALDLQEKSLMKKYKPDIWLFYILTMQTSRVLEKVGKITPGVHGPGYVPDRNTELYDDLQISVNADYHLEGHAYQDYWGDDLRTEGDSGKTWAEGNHDVMRLRTVTHHQWVPLYNDEMKNVRNSKEKEDIFLSYFKKSAGAFSRVMVPEAIVDNATFALINYMSVLKETHNYNYIIEPGFTFHGPKMQFFDVILDKFATGLEFCRFVSTQHFKIIFLRFGVGCAYSLISEKSHFTIQGRGGGGKSNALRELQKIMIPGVCQTLTHSSTLAGIDLDCFNTVVLEHEQDPDMTGQGGNKRTNDQLKKNEIRKNMKTNGENKTMRLERGGKDKPMRTVVENSIHSKCFIGCTNRPYSERDHASRDRDCELTLPKISRIGKDITMMENAASQQTDAQKEAADRFHFLLRTFDFFEHKVRAGQDQPLLFPPISNMVWSDVLSQTTQTAKHSQHFFMS